MVTSHSPEAEARQVGRLLGLVAGAPYHVAGMMRPALDEGVGQLLDEDGVLHRVELGRRPRPRSSGGKSQRLERSKSQISREK